MNDTSNPNPSQPPDESHPENAAHKQSSSSAGRCVFEPLRSAIHDGARCAQAAAERTIPKVKVVVTSVTYWLGYGASFASVFSYTMVKELAPEALKSGCRDGAQAGRKTASALASKTQPGAPEAPSDAGSGSAPQPGAA